MRELSDEIWNQSGKHTHNELDDRISTQISSLLTTIIGEIEAEKIVPEFSKDDVYFPTFVAGKTANSGEVKSYNNGIRDALKIIRNKLEGGI